MSVKLKITEVSDKDTYYRDNLVGTIYEVDRDNIKDWGDGWSQVYNAIGQKDMPYTFFEIKYELIEDTE